MTAHAAHSIRAYRASDLDAAIAIFLRAIREVAARDGHLAMMFVHPAHQGQGVASALFETVEASVRAGDLLRIFTEATLAARPFFERRGFSIVTAQLAEKRGQFLRNFRMEKVLG